MVPGVAQSCGALRAFAMLTPSVSRTFPPPEAETLNPNRTQQLVPTSPRTQHLGAPVYVLSPELDRSWCVM